MKINFKDTSNRTGHIDTKTMSSVPLSPKSGFHSTTKSDLNTELYIKKRPLKTNSTNLSFEGLFFSPVLDKATSSAKIFNLEEILETTSKHLGTSTKELFENLTKNHNSGNLTSTEKLSRRMISIKDGNQVTFQKKTVLNLLYDGLIYPIKILPADILNGTVSMLRKFKPTSNWANKIYEKPMFKNIRQRSKIDSKINTIRGTFETVTELNEKLAKGEITKDQLSSELFQRRVKMFDSKTGNYDTKHERSLNRVVSGAIPAVFLANDAYNLSSMCDNNPKEAQKEKKVRFKQELSRVGLQAYITLVTLGALQKFINNSKFGIMLMTGLTVLSTEMFSRLTNGKRITRLTPEQAQEMNAKGQSPIANQKEAPKKSENNYKSVFFKSAEKRKAFATFGATQAPSFKGFTQPTAPPVKKQEPLLGFNSVLKASAISIGVGLSLKGLRSFKILEKNLPKVLDKKTGEMVYQFRKPVLEAMDKMFKPFSDAYKKLAQEQNHKISRKEFNEIVEKIEEAGETPLAQKYKDVAENIKETLTKKELSSLLKKDASDLVGSPDVVSELTKRGLNDLAKNAQSIIDKHTNNVYLGKKDKKAKLAIDFVIAPFKFIYGTVALPYNLGAKLIKMFAKKQPPVPKDYAKLDGEALSKSIENIGKQIKSKNYNKAAFSEYLALNTQKAFNVDNVSNVSNSELANLAKTSATAATIWFLMADNYNMVMQKSNGKDVEGAELKSKERLVQEGSRFFYQTLLIDLFNTTFRTQYNKSLLGMSWVTAACTGIGEYLTRASVGVPVGKLSRDEIIAYEKKKDASTGFLKGYYNFMSRLTGKKSLVEQNEAKQASKA